MNRIILKDVDLTYQLQTETGIKDFILRGRKQKIEVLRERSIHALKNFSLEINEGDKIAVIGHNGAGKSSLLKLIAGIYPPSSGTLEVEGRIATLFELATGFEMEATGWDNILLRGLMLGETPASMKEKAKSIAEFSELGDYLNIPVKYYSSGMFIRLAFSVSTSIEPDILLLDEVMAAGDAHFLAKAQARMYELVDKVKILVFVTHSMSSAIDFCNKCIWLEHGQIRMMGTPTEVTKAYIDYTQSLNAHA